ncbi:MAG: hypothetical protein LUI87_13770 [Lachnospiraceae bacterium]|nr:hypothetical protein [Lachnospiraceae bacterium]
MTIKINIRNVFAYFSVLLIVFQPLLCMINSIFGYTDEIIAILCGLYYILTLFLKHPKKEYDSTMLLLMFLLLVTGVIGNIVYNIQSSFLAIILDVFATFKCFVIYMGIKSMYTSPDENKKILHNIASIFRVYMFIVGLFAIINLFVDIGMSDGLSYGLRAFKFIYSGSGDFSLVCYSICFVILLDMAVQKASFGRKEIIIAATILLIWSSSLVTRAIAYMLLFLAMLLLLSFSKSRLKWYHFVPLGISVLFVGYSSIQYFFYNANTARSQLLINGIRTMVKYFPFGAGFATYGSDMAYKYYSPLYELYGFNSIFGLSRNSTMVFANDSFWPEIMGQFGVIGAVIFIIFIILLYKKCVHVCITRTQTLVIQWIMAVLLVGSVGSKTYIHYIMIPVFIALSLFENYASNQAKTQVEPKYQG